MKRCKVCRKKPKLERKMNCEGIVFCSDECYDLFDDSPNDFKHPYIEDYEAARRIYGDWLPIMRKICIQTTGEADR